MCTRVRNASRGGKKGKKAISERVAYNTACIITLAPLDVSPSISNGAIYTHTYKCIRTAHGGKNEIKHETRITRTSRRHLLDYNCVRIILYGYCSYTAVIYYIKYIRPGRRLPVRTAVLCSYIIIYILSVLD